MPTAKRKATYKNIGDKIVEKIRLDEASLTQRINLLEHLGTETAPLTREELTLALRLRIERDVLRGVLTDAIEVIIDETGKYDA